MDPVLLGATLILLLLAAVLAVVAVRLLRGSRAQAAARIEALQALIAGATAAPSEDVRADDADAMMSASEAEWTSEPAMNAPVMDAPSQIRAHAHDTESETLLDEFELEPALEPADSDTVMMRPREMAHEPAPPAAVPVTPDPAPLPVFAMPASVTTHAPAAADVSFLAPMATDDHIAIDTTPTRRVPHPTASSTHDESWDLALRAPRVAPPPAPRPAAPLPRRASAPARRLPAPIAPVEPLFEPPEQRTPSHRWSALAMAAVIVAAIIGAIYVAATRDVVGTIAQAFSGRGTATTNAGAAPLELLSLRHSTEAGEFILTGLVQNPPAGVSLRGVVAVVYLFDGENRYFASGKAPLEVPMLATGAEAPFVIRVPAVQGVSRYRVGFRHEDGAVVAHVDRRGALPEGTTGATVDGERRIEHVPTTNRVIG